MVPAETNAGVTVLAEADWRARALRHRERLRPWTEAARARRRRHRSHPVHDFLFQYYSYRPSRLEFWHPPLGTALRFSDPALAAPFRGNRRYRISVETLALDPAQLTARDLDACEWILNLLEAIDARPARFGCAGLHEWAMICEDPADGIRHEEFSLRLSPAEIAEVVRENPVSCTHYDAFRFFSAAARPLNAVRPTRDGMLDFEQGGCLHANMDLYKWSYKLAPWIGSDLIAESFFHARDGRELDMRASPYDLSALGFQPVRIESPEGRREYEKAQRALSASAAPLRKKLIAGCRNLLAQAPRKPLDGRDQPKAGREGFPESQGK